MEELEDEIIGGAILIEGEEIIIPEVNIPIIQGEKGEKGDSNTLTIGTVTKGEEASATITGESPNQILNLVLPKGDKGDKGEQGEQGIPGEKGADGQDGQNGQDGYTPVKGTDYFTESEIQQIQSNVLDKVNQFSVRVVQELPTENIDDHTIYFVLKTNTEQNDVYDEYIYVNNDWEHIGTTAVDLSNYYNKEEVDNKVANIQALPAGGTTGQVLTKQSDTDGDANWEDAIVGDTLPVGTIVNYDGDTVPDGYVEVEDEGEIYSTTEQVIGKWINGKPIYRRTISLSSGWTANNEQKIYFDTPIDNLDEYTNISGVTKLSNGSGEISYAPLSFLHTDTNWQIAIMQTTAQYITLRVGTKHCETVQRMISCTIQLEYTKTTDTVGV